MQRRRRELLVVAWVLTVLLLVVAVAGLLLVTGGVADRERTPAVHEPPLFGLVAEDPDLQPMIQEANRRIGAVSELIRAELPMLHVFSSNSSAIALYRRQGMEIRRRLWVTVLQRQI